MTESRFASIMQDIDHKHAAMDALVSLYEEGGAGQMAALLEAARADERAIITPLLDDMRSALATKHIDLCAARSEQGYFINIALRLMARRESDDRVVSTDMTAAIHINGNHQFETISGERRRHCSAGDISAAAEDLFRALYANLDTNLSPERRAGRVNAHLSPFTLM
ncbi:MAG: hypothetical protein ACX939_02275 [Hyphococcus sp.]